MIIPVQQKIKKNTNVFECHVIDGIEKPRKALTDNIFEENKVENIIVKGV